MLDFAPCKRRSSIREGSWPDYHTLFHCITIPRPVVARSTCSKLLRTTSNRLFFSVRAPGAVHWQRSSLSSNYLRSPQKLCKVRFQHPSFLERLNREEANSPATPCLVGGSGLSQPAATKPWPGGGIYGTRESGCLYTIPLTLPA